MPQARQPEMVLQRSCGQRVPRVAQRPQMPCKQGLGRNAILAKTAKNGAEGGLSGPPGKASHTGLMHAVSASSGPFCRVVVVNHGVLANDTEIARWVAWDLARLWYSCTACGCNQGEV